MSERHQGTRRRVQSQVMNRDLRHSGSQYVPATPHVGRVDNARITGHIEVRAIHGIDNDIVQRDIELRGIRVVRQRRPSRQQKARRYENQLPCHGN